MLNAFGDCSQLLNIGSSSDHEAIATSELVESQYANLVALKDYFIDIDVDHSTDIPLQAMFIQNHMISAQDAYYAYRTAMLNYFDSQNDDPEAVIPLTLIDKESGESFTTTVDEFMKEFNNQCDTAAISSALLQQVAFDVQKDAISTMDEVRSSISWALGELPAEVSNSLNSALHEIYTGVEEPLDLYYNVRNFIGLDADGMTQANMFDDGFTKLGQITGASPLKSIGSGIITTYIQFYKGAATTIAKSVVHGYYVGKFLWTIFKESWRLQWKITKWTYRKIGNKLRTTYIDPVDFECSKRKIGYFDAQMMIVLPYRDSYFSDYLTAENRDRLYALSQWLSSNGPVTMQLYGNEFQLGLNSDNHIVIIHRQKPFDYGSVYERMGKDLGKNSWLLNDFQNLNTLYSRVSDMDKGTDEKYLLNSLSFARAHAGATLLTLRELLEAFEEGHECGDLSSTWNNWTNASYEKKLASAIYEGYVFGKCMIDGTYPASSGNHDVLGLSAAEYNDIYHEYASSVNNKDFYNVLTSVSVAQNGNYDLNYGCQSSSYYVDSPAKYFVPRFSSSGEYGIGRMYIDLAIIAAMVLTSPTSDILHDVSCIKFYRGTSRFKTNTTIKTDKDNTRSALIFTGAVAAVVILTIAAIKLTPKLIAFKNKRRLLAEQYNTRAFNIGQKVLDGDTEGALLDLKANRKTKRFLNLTGGSSGLISSGMTVAAIDASGVIDRLNQSITTLNTKSQASDDYDNIIGYIEEMTDDVKDHVDDEISTVSSLIV